MTTHNANDASPQDAPVEEVRSTVLRRCLCPVWPFFERSAFSVVYPLDRIRGVDERHYNKLCFDC